ncbi:DNA-binding response regulator, partial [Micromonospora arborensis]
PPTRAAPRGETVLPPPAAAPPAQQARTPPRPATTPILSAREVQVLSLVATGHTNADIGRVLHITEATVKTHLLRAFNKLDVSDRTAAVTTAMALG